MGKRAGRIGQSGTPITERDVSVTVPAITAGATGEVALTADLAFKGKTRVNAEFRGTTVQANLALAAAYVSNPTTGVVTLRFIAGTGNVAGGAQLMTLSAE